MTRAGSWDAANERYLAAALAWLRLRLTRLAQPETQTEAELTKATATLAKAEAATPAPVLVALADQFGLSRFEQEILLLCAAMELDTRIPALCAKAQADPNLMYPTFGLALALFDEPAWDALSPWRPLRYWRLIEIHQTRAEPLIASLIRADERIVHFLKGLNNLDERLASLLVAVEAVDQFDDIPPSQSALVETAVRGIEQAIAQRRKPLVQLIGADPASSELIAWHVAKRLGLHLYRLPVELLPAHSVESQTLARLWHRESLLLPVALYLDTRPSDQTSASEGHIALRRFLERTDGAIFLDAREVLPELTRQSFLIDVEKPTPAEQRDAWSSALGPAASSQIGLLSSQFNLSASSIQQIASAVYTDALDDDTLSERIWSSTLATTRPRMSSLAQRIEPKASREGIVLPPNELRLLLQITDQVRQRPKVYDAWGYRHRLNRGLGISALFAGESGTGKTMAAEMIANELRLNLYRIDLSAVVSKYIGETEKNLRKLFDAAEDGGAILFFDEADALFGRRSEVKDSHDRYANIEINYLLQRMEAFGGLAILATNMKSALDPAFTRRLRFIVNFPFPGQAERRMIWQKAVPPETPVAQLDFDRLASLNLTGGSIHNIALNATFLAAKAGGPLTMPLLLSAARDEFRKLERSISEADFHWQDAIEVVA